jgi:hypothetical protein
LSIGVLGRPINKKIQKSNTPIQDSEILNDDRLSFIRLHRNTLQLVGVERKSRPAGLQEASFLRKPLTQCLQRAPFLLFIKDQNPVRVLRESKIQDIFGKLFGFPGFNDLLSRPFHADHLVHSLGTAPDLFDGVLQYAATTGPFLVNNKALSVK